MRKRTIFTGIGLAVVVGIVLIAASHHHKTATPVVRTSGSYLAMGDSVAAGEGLPTYSDSSACDRTNESYPNLVATQQHYALTSVACSGATTTAGLIGPQNVNDLLVAPQIQSLSAQHEPRLVTITVGANDTQWTSLLQTCYTATCGSSDDSAAVTAGMQTASQNLSTALTTIARTYAHPPRVIVTGYYQLFSANPVANCPELTGIDPSELQWISGLQSTINSAIRDTVHSYDFATYVEPNFNGHELCSSDPWIQGLAAKAPFHPTQAGQAALARAILHVLSSKGESL